MVDIFFRTVRDPLTRLLEHFFAFSKSQGVGGASFDTSWHDDIGTEGLALLGGQFLSVSGQRKRLIQPVGAVRALLDLGGQRIPLRCRHTPRACPNAVAASNALTRSVGDRSVRAPCQSGSRAGRCARRIQTVETAMHRENVIESSRRLLVWEFMKRDQRVRFCAERRGILKSQLAQLQFGLFPFAI